MREFLAFLDQHGHAPTEREVALGLGLSQTTVRHHVRVMVAAGLMRRGCAGLARSITPTERGKRFARLQTSADA